MPNRFYEYNGTVPNGVVFSDPAKISSTAELRQVLSTRNVANVGPMTDVRGSFVMKNTFPYTQPGCADACGPLLLKPAKISLEITHTVGQELELEKMWDAFAANLPIIKERFLAGRTADINYQLVAETSE